MKTLFQIILIVFILSLLGCKSGPTNQIQFLKSKEEKKKDLPFSDAVKVGDLLFLAGQIGMDHSSRTLVEGGIKVETAQALNNIKEVLELNNSSLEKVIKCTVILSDINDFAAMNEVYKTFFKNNFPARTTFSAGLVAGAKIEIEVIALSN